MAYRMTKCVFCQSKNIVKLIYGRPNEQLVEKIARGEVALAECTSSVGQPTHLCKNCRATFTRDSAKMQLYRDILYCDVSIGGFHKGHKRAVIDFTEKRALFEHVPFRKEQREIVLNERFQEPTRLAEVNVLDWKKSYFDPFILDGIQWELKLIGKHQTFEKSGSNSYPEQWDLFCALLDEMLGDQLFAEHFEDEE